MFKIKAPTEKGLVSLLITYFIFIPVAVILFWRIIQDISVGKSYSFLRPFTYVIISGAVIVTAIVLIVFFRNLRHVQSKSNLRAKLITAFAVTAILASIPQTVIAYIFIQTSLKSWLPQDIDDALNYSEDIAIEKLKEKSNNLIQFIESSFAEKKAEEVIILKEQAWNEIKKTNSEIDSIQVIDQDGQTTLFFGDPTAKIASTETPSLTKIRTDNDSNAILSEAITITVDDQTYEIIYSTVIYEYIKMSSKIRETRKRFKPIFYAKATMQRNLTLALISFIFPIAIIIAIMSVIFSNVILSPLMRIENALNEVAEGNLDIRIMTSRKDSLYNLSNSINKMASELQKNRSSSAHTDKLSAWQDIARRLAHEINNPLTPIILSAQRLQKRFRTLDTEELYPLIETSTSAIIKEAENIQTMLNEFRNFSRLPKPQKENVSLSKIIEEVISIYKNTPEKQVEFNTTELKHNIQVFADKNQIRQVISNLIKNSIEAFEKNGNIVIRTSLISKKDNFYCRLTIEDDGPGISEEIKSKLFTPYETTKKNGTGLGLAIAERIIFTHNGRIYFNSETGVGTTFFIDLPTAKNNRR
ncbi:MAG: HAMP domain-containing protein [Spirochaetales bacterium]|nr:HAMP domain-containing protein [Spirochaetales bacterium]